MENDEMSKDVLIGCQKEIRDVIEVAEVWANLVDYALVEGKIMSLKNRLSALNKKVKELEDDD